MVIKSAKKTILSAAVITLIVFLYFAFTGCAKNKDSLNDAVPAWTESDGGDDITVKIETETEIIVEETSETVSEAEQETTTGFTGYNEKTYNNGDTYEGNFVNGIRSGQGTYTWADGMIVYIGEFIDGDPSGNGKYIYPTEAPTEPPLTTQPPPTEPPPATVSPTTTESPPPVYIAEAPLSNFMQIMFDTAIEIPDSENKIESPPEGRSLELQYGAVPLSETIPEPFAYFKNIIFLGDSMTTGFDLYRTVIKFNGENVLRDTTVVAAVSYGVYNATRAVSDKSIHPLFNGKKTLCEDIIATKGAKYVLICLGLNDLEWQKTDDFIFYYSTLINRIKEKSPDKTIVIMSVTPVVAGTFKNSVLNNEKITEANNALLKFAIENNIKFIDYAAAIRDSRNNLYSELSSDAFCHFKVSAYDRLVEYLLYHPLRD